MAAEPVPARELATLHERIGREVAELRRRARGWQAARRPVSDDPLEAAAETLRALRALRRIAPTAGLALIIVTGLLAGLAVRFRAGPRTQPHPAPDRRREGFGGRGRSRSL